MHRYVSIFLLTNFYWKWSRSACAPFANHPISLSLSSSSSALQAYVPTYLLQVCDVEPASQPEAAFFNVIPVGYRPASYSACHAMQQLLMIMTTTRRRRREGSQATANSTFQLVARLVLGINDSDLLENGTLLRSRAQLLIGTLPGPNRLGVFRKL